MELFGFTLLRNGVKYDYPFRESLQSLSGITQKIYLALGNSEDSTEDSLSLFQQKLVLIPTVWDETKRAGGEILSEQTNIALQALRNAVKRDHAWGFYLQADEVLNEAEYEKILADIRSANEQGYDAVSFRYLHFWQSYDSIAIHKRWYPQEIRAIRLNSSLESYGDAQSFRGATKIFYSDAHIHHYGHVREKAAYERKLKDFHRWWHKDEELEKVYSAGHKSDKKEKTLRYLGPHPRCMHDRMLSQGWQPAVPAEELFIFGKQEDFSQNFVKHIHAKNVLWTEDWHFLRRQNPNKVVVLKTLSFFEKFLAGFRFRSNVPKKMYSPQARAWQKEFRALLKFSEKGVAVQQ